MNLLIITEFFDPIESGAEKVVRMFADYVGRNKKIHITILTNKIKGRLDCERRNNYCILRKLLHSKFRKIEKISVEFFRLWNFVPILHILRRNRFDIVNIYGFNALFFSGTFASKILRIPVVLVMCASDIYDLKKRKHWSYFCIRFAVLLCDIFVAKGMSPTPMKTVLKVPDEKFRWVVNPVAVEIEHTKKLRKNTMLQRKLGLENKFVLGTNGKLHCTKSPDILIDALGLIADKDIVVVFSGDGPLKTFCQEKVRKLALKDRVFFLPYTANVTDNLSLYDVYVFPTVLEPALSQAMMEAMLYGIPTIVGFSEAITHWFTNKSDCCIIDSMQPTELAKAIIGLRRDNLLRNKLALTCRRTILRNHSIPQFADALMDINVSLVPTKTASLSALDYKIRGDDSPNIR